MKCFYTFLLSLFMYAQVSAQGNLAALDAKYGFNDAKFGMPSSAFRGLQVAIRHSNSIITYNRPPFKVGDIQLSFVSYTFISGKLANIEFGSEAPNCKELIKAIKIAYGNPNKDDRWIGNKVNMLYIDVDPQKVFFRIEVNNLSQLWRQAEAFDKSQIVKKRLQGL